MALPARVRLVEVGPRDGLQNEKAMVPTDVKVALIDLLTDAGFAAIEATSFVSPKWVPQMADAADVMARIRRKPGVRYPVLTPNMKGFERRCARQGRRGRGVRRGVGVLLAEEHQLLDRREPRARAPDLRRGGGQCGIRVRGYISCVLGCPYEGDVDPRTVAEVAATRCTRWAPTRSRWATRSAPARPARPQALLAAVRASSVPVAALAGHFHDTYGQALTNVYAALELGVATFDCSVAGLGGCPYAKGATGNVASEDVVYLLQGLGIETGVDMTRAAPRRPVHFRLPAAAAGIARRARAERQVAARRMTCRHLPPAAPCRRRAPACARWTRSRGFARAAFARSTKSRCGACWTTTTSARSGSALRAAPRRPLPRADCRCPALTRALPHRCTIADWYFDFVSPFAYLQSEQLARLAPAITIRYKPVLFAGLLEAHGQKGPAEIAAKRAFTYRFVIWRGEAARHSAQVAARASVQSAAAAAPRHRLRLRRPTAIHRIFRFVWRDGRLPDLPDRVGGTDARPGIARCRRAHRRSGSQGRRCAAIPTRRSRRGVFGVPTLGVARRIVLGCGRDADGRGLCRRPVVAGPIRNMRARRTCRSARRATTGNGAQALLTPALAFRARTRRRRECASARLTARAVASASSSVAPRQVTCPILRPRRASALP